MPVTTDFAGTETLAETKSRLGTLLTAYGYDSSGYSTWGDARTDLNSALTAIEETTISDGELASSFRSKLNALNAWSDYPAGGKVPNLVFDFEDEFYRANDTETTFGDSITFSRASSATYVDSDGVLQTAASGVPRIGHHVWNGSAWVNEGLLHESEARTQLLHTTNALVTQSKTVTAVPHTLHFTGTGTVTLSGASTAGPLVGTGAGEQNRVSLTFTPSAGTLTLTVSGTVTDAQLEVGSTPSSYIPNLAGSGEVTRAAETLTIPAAKLPWPTPNVIGSEQSPSFSTWAVVLTGTWASGGGAAYAFTDTVGGQTRPGVVWDQAILTAGKVYQAVIDVASITGATQLRIDNLGLSDVLVGAGQTSFEFVASATAASSGPRIRIEDTSTTINDGFSLNSFSVREIDPLSVSIQMQGQLNYADTNSNPEARLVLWVSGANYIRFDLRTDSARTGALSFYQSPPAIQVASSDTYYSPGINVPYNIASRHGSTFINGATDGTALTAKTTPGLPDLSATDLNLGYDYMGTIRTFRMWDQDLGDTGIEEASA